MKLNYKIMSVNSFRYITVFISLIVTSVAFGFEMDQTFIEMNPQGLSSKKIVKLTNTAPYRKFITIEVMERKWNGKTNKEERTPTSDIKVSEIFVQLEPQGEMKVALEWNGKKDFKGEKAYRAIFTEVKNENKAKAQLIEPLVQFVTSVFVSFEGLQENVKIQKVEVKNKNKVMVTVSNDGSKHKALSNMGLTVSDSKNKNQLFKLDRVEAFQQALLMPGQKKTFEINVGKEFDQKSVVATLVSSK